MQNRENSIDSKAPNWSKNNGIQYLMELGLTRTQANLYLNLMIHGETDARLLASLAGLPRTEVYRALSELQEKGLVDKELGSVLKFSAVPPSIGLQEFIDQKTNKVIQMQESLKKFSIEFEGKQEQEKEQDFKITIIEGRKRVLAKIMEQHDQAKFTVDIITFLPRFLQIATESMENYRKATERGVKYRIIIGLINEKLELPEDMSKAHFNKNTVIKTMIGARKVNCAIFDGKHASFSYYPDRPITESPYVITNHPCLVEFAQNTFEHLWESLAPP